jgi:hypothetical protein
MVAISSRCLISSSSRVDMAFQDYYFIDRHFGTCFNVIFIIEEIGIFIVVFPFPAIAFGVDPLRRSPFSTIILVGIGDVSLIRRGLVVLGHIHLSVGVWVGVIAYADSVDREMLLVASGSSLLFHLVRGSYL